MNGRIFIDARLTPSVSRLVLIKITISLAFFHIKNELIVALQFVGSFQMVQQNRHPFFLVLVYHCMTKGRGLNGFQYTCDLMFL